MLLKAIHRIVSLGPVYDLIQGLLGLKIASGRVGRALSNHTSYGAVLDMGGGTGRIREILNNRCKYYCLDNESPKLAQFHRRFKSGFAVQGDATDAPIASASMDLILFMSVSHHLTDAEFGRIVLEIVRILRPGGG